MPIFAATFMVQAQERSHKPQAVTQDRLTKGWVGLIPSHVGVRGKNYAEHT